jgi:methionyl-tRNA formyltransferase
MTDEDVAEGTESENLVQLAETVSKILETEISVEKVRSLIAVVKILESSGHAGLKQVLKQIEEERISIEQTTAFQKVYQESKAFEPWPVWKGVTEIDERKTWELNWPTPKSWRYDGNSGGWEK